MAELKITNNIANTTATGTADTDGGAGTIIITANDGFKFVTAPTCAFENYDGNYDVRTKFTLSEDGKTATGQPQLVDLKYSTFVLTGEVIEDDVTTPQVNNSIANTTAQITATGDTGATVTVTGKYNKRYGFYNPVVSYLSTDGTTKTATDVQFSFNSSNREIMTVNIADIDFSQPVYVTGQYVNNICRVNSVELNNCRATGLDSRYLKTSELNIVITADKGFKFDETPMLYYSDGYGYGTTQHYPSTLSEDSKTATFAFNLSVLEDEQYSCEYSDGISFVAHTVADVKAPTVVNEITGVEIDFSTSVSEDGNSITITAEVKSGSPNKVNFTETPVAHFTDTTGVEQAVTFEIDSTGYKAKATATVTNFDVNTDIIVTGEVSEIVSATEEFENCSVVGFKSFYKPNETVNITLTANDKCLFDIETPPVMVWYSEVGYPMSQAFAVSADRKTASITVDLSTLDITTGNGISFGGGAIPDTGGSEKNYGAINVYIVTDENLQQFAQKRFVKYNEDGTGELIDLAKYINRIRRVFIDVADRVSNVVKLGNYNLDIDCFSPTIARKTLDFGSVLIPQQNNDVTDYNSEISLFLPFIGFQSVDNAFCGKELNVQYEIDLITGDGVAKLFIEDRLIDVFNCQPSAEVLYRLSDLTQIGGEDYNPQIMYGLQPFIKYKWFMSENDSVVNADCERVIIGNVKGYAKFTEVTDIVSPQMTGDEKKQIYSLLNTGVYVEQQTN